MMKVKEIFDVLDNIIADGNNLYSLGLFGQKITQSVLDGKATQYKKWYKETKSKQDAKLTNYDYIKKHLGAQGYDCVCLLKGILWGSKVGVCGKYQSNGVPDIGSNEFFNKCYDVVGVKDAQAGMIIWFEGHVGIVYDKDTVYEISPKTGKVVKHTIKFQPWQKCGRSPYIDYSDVDSKSTTSDNKNAFMPTLRIGDAGKAVVIWQVMIGAEVNGLFDKSTTERTIEFQKKVFPNQPDEHDGIVGKKTWSKAFEHCFKKL